MAGLPWDPSFGGSVIPPSVPIAKTGQKYPHSIGIFFLLASEPLVGLADPTEIKTI